jgi:cyclopropane fatty-acyl-phospholipid synthase-like methyltransferase
MDSSTQSAARRIVAQGYDRMGGRYLDAVADGAASVRVAYLDKLLSLLSPAGVVLELGCGAGVPVTRFLAEHHRVVGVDVSPGQLRLARVHVPDAQLIQADMSSLHFAPDSFDAVVAFYAISHVPREEHSRLIGRVHGWLRPGGVFLATMGVGDDPGSIEEDWLGVSMFFSSYDAGTNRDLVRDAGLVVLEADVVSETEHDGADVSFLWMIARKPLDPAGAPRGS